MIFLLHIIEVWGFGKTDTPKRYLRKVGQMITSSKLPNELLRYEGEEMLGNNYRLNPERIPSREEEDSSIKEKIIIFLYFSRIILDIPFYLSSWKLSTYSVFIWLLLANRMTKLQQTLTFFLNVQAMQAPRATHDRVLLNNVGWT